MLFAVYFLGLCATDICERSVLDFRSSDLLFSSGLWLSKYSSAGSGAELGKIVKGKSFL